MLKKLLSFITLSVLLCACTNDTREELTFSSWGSITETQILEKIISDFEVENPDIKINFLHIPQNYFQKIHLLFASNQAPDIIFMNNLYLPIYADKLEILDNIIDKENFFQEGINALSYNEHCYAVPRDISNLVFYYNKELLDINATEWNFGYFEKLLETKLNNAWTIGFEPDIYYAIPFVITFGGNILDNNYDNKQTKTALDFYRNLEGKYAPTRADVGSSTLAQMFLDKKIALYLSGKWMYPKISEKANFDWGVLPFPGITSLDASGWAISKTGKHKKSAYKFIKYLSSEQSLNYFTKTGLIVPARIDSAQILNNERESIFLDTIKISQKTPVNKNYKKITDEMNKKLF